MIAVLRACRRHGTPVVARGAGTGLSGGALPVEGGVLLVLARLNRILEVDAARRLARVEPGVTNLEISQAAAPHGLYYAPDPSSQVACTIGGNVAENSGGVHCLKHGLTVHNLLEVRVATIDGEWLAARLRRRRVAGAAAARAADRLRGHARRGGRGDRAAEAACPSASSC